MLFEEDLMSAATKSDLLLKDSLEEESISKQQPSSSGDHEKTCYS